MDASLAQQTAKRLFKYVAGVLNGAFSESQVSNYVADIQVWESQITSDCISYESACDALASAINEGHVPQQGLDVLNRLVTSPSPKAPETLVSASLREVLSSEEASCEVVPSMEMLVGESMQSLSKVISSDVGERLRIADCADLAQLDSSYPLREVLVGRNNANIDFIFSETGVLLSLSQDDAGQLTFACTDHDARLTERQLDCAFELARDLVLDATTSFYDQWLKETHEIESANECLRVEDDRKLEEQTLTNEMETQEYEKEVLVLEEGEEEEKQQQQQTEVSPREKETQHQENERQKPARTNVNNLFRFVTGILMDQELPEKAWATIKEIIFSTDECVVEDAEDIFLSASRLLARSIRGGEVPRAGMHVLQGVKVSMAKRGADELFDSLSAFMCPVCAAKPPRADTCDTCNDSRQSMCTKCSGSGRHAPVCRSCNGTGRGYTKKECPTCGGTGKKDLGSCNSCQGKKISLCTHCVANPDIGLPRPLCAECVTECDIKAKRVASQSGTKGKGKGKDQGPPPPGMTIEKCSAGDLTRLKQLWEMRGANGFIEAAWKVDNPLRTYAYTKRRSQLREELGNKEPDSLEGFHGTHPDAVLSICDAGFDKSRRSGQVYGAGEYFAKNPNISVGYCRGGQYMLVCRLTLGYESSTPDNRDGDHIWVPNMGYYVIKEPDQVLPQFIIRFSNQSCGYSGVQSSKLEATLLNDKWTTKAKEEIRPVPAQRPCNMKRDFAKVLWMGFLHAHLSDESLEADVRCFLQKHAKAYVTKGMKIQIVKGHFKKAHAILEIPMPRELVRKLNQVVFVENGSNRTICVEDGHGSPGQQCPRYIAGYCRGQNLRYTHPCWCDHPARPTKEARYTLTKIDLAGAKGTELLDKFYASAPFHNGHPKVIAIRQITNETLSRCHEEYRRYLCTKHMEEPAVQELYHGTNNNIVDVLYQHGLQPPSDTNASDKCPISGGKGLCTTLCNNDCKYCTEPHQWNKCHMYGLGIYLADMAQKSHRYCSQPRMKNGAQTYRMVVCSVLGKAFQVEGHLKTASSMHDVVNVRALDDEMMEEMIEPCQACRSSSGVGATIQGIDGSKWGRVVADEGHCWRLHTGRMARKETEGYRWQWAYTIEVACDNLESAEKSDLIFVKGLGGNVRPGYSVVNSEYIAFHPHQCLPKYEIEYELR